MTVLVAVLCVLTPALLTHTRYRQKAPENREGACTIQYASHQYYLGDLIGTHFPPYIYSIPAFGYNTLARGEYGTIQAHKDGTTRFPTLGLRVRRSTYRPVRGNRGGRVAYGTHGLSGIIEYHSDFRSWSRGLGKLEVPHGLGRERWK